jgi:fructosamine-3-kinase
VTFVKQRADAPAGFFEAEAAGLRWLAVPGGVPVPEPLEVAPGRLVLPRLDQTGPYPAAADAFGRALTVTHAAGAEGFGTPPTGWTGPGYIGDAPLAYADRPDLTWGEFYASLRVAPYVRTARDTGAFGPDEVAVFDKVCSRLAGGDFDTGDEPARIHGDLWAGNVLWCAGDVHLIDPAAHGGHRETDLAMLDVFGLPHLDRVLAAYDEAAPLANGWRDRMRLHQLHPLLVHVVLFGGGYVGQALAAARPYR